MTAEYPHLGGRITLKQRVPGDPVFMSACFSEEHSEQRLEEGSEMGLTIHAKADIKNGGKECKNVGPHFNPFNVLHGGPDKPMKHVGDLGNIQLKKKPKAPSNWTTAATDDDDDIKCKEGELGFYRQFTHFCMFMPATCPGNKPLVIHKDKDEGDEDRGKNKDNEPIACAVIRDHTNGKDKDNKETRATTKSNMPNSGENKKKGAFQVTHIYILINLIKLKIITSTFQKIKSQVDVFKVMVITCCFSAGQCLPIVVLVIVGVTKFKKRPI